MQGEVEGLHLAPADLAPADLDLVDLDLVGASSHRLASTHVEFRFPRLQIDGGRGTTEAIPIRLAIITNARRSRTGRRPSPTLLL